MAKLSCAEIIAIFRQKSASMSCKEVIRALESLGFIVKAGSKGKHHTYTHPKLVTLRANFDCGHGRNPDVLPVYVKSIANVLEEFEESLK
jgi:predicted RNA binding protein YcfA (HicA-like mRNA interferase family)